MKTTSVILAVAGAAIAGAATALLLAPQSGRRTRRDIERFIRDTRDKYCNKVDDIAEQIAAEIETVKK
ncbi:MAG: YtxH domain-containing protein [Muribaculaceae bacterium]|nr:YtxH domain-containing protein [Muribaculaceae bacterium]